MAVGKGIPGMLKSSMWVMLMMLVLALTGRAVAQVSTASISGIVHDPTGARIPKAKVVLRNLGTSVEHTTISNSSGVYSFFNINPGEYSITVKAPGFRSKQIPNLTLTVSQAATINFSLVVGSTNSTVTVQGVNPELKTSSASLGTVISSKQVNELPLNGRNFTELLALTPGVSPVSTGQNASGWLSSAANGSTQLFPEVNGQSSRSDFFLTDGLFNYGEFISTYAVPPIIDAIQEFKVVSHTDDAQFGGVLGGVIDVSTKSGTNHLHGSAWEYTRNAVLDAKGNYFDPTVPKTPFHQNQFGGSIGGPVWIPKLYNGKNRTFFFGAYQGFRFYQVSDTPLRVPTAAELSGNFSSYPTKIYNPFTFRPDPNHPGQYIGDPFPGNQIPASLLQPGWVAYAKFAYPAAGPVFNSAGDNAVDTTPSTQQQNEWDIRVDQKIGANDSAFFRYSALNDTSVSSAGLPNDPSTTLLPARNWGGSYVHVFSPSLVLQLDMSHTTMPNISQNFFTKPTTSVVKALNLAPSFATGWVAVPNTTMLPVVGIGNYSGIAGDYFNSNELTDDWQYSASLEKTINNHSLHFGGGFTTMHFSSSTAYPFLGFSAQNTADPNLNDSVNRGSALASYLLGVLGSDYLDNNALATRPGGVADGYAQDSWKVTPKLTLNYGLRYDVTFTPQLGVKRLTAYHGGPYVGDMDFSNGTYIIENKPPACNVKMSAPCIPGNGTLPAHVVVSPNGIIFHNDYNDIAPRVGFAYEIGNSRVVRGGFGIFYDNWAAVMQIVQNLNGTWPDTGNFGESEINLPSSASATPTITAANPYGSSGGVVLPSPTPFTAYADYADPQRKSPRSDEWNIGIEQELAPSTSLTVNYVGSISRRLDVGGTYNTALTPGPGDPQPRAKYPYMPITGYDRPVGKANYNALQVSLIRRFTAGWSYSVAYTWSKTINDGTDGWFGSEGGEPQDPYYPAGYGSRSVAGFDLTNVLALDMVYEVPFGAGKKFSTGNRVLNYALGHWQFNNIFTAHSGMPYTPVAGADIANIGGGEEYLNKVGNPHLSNPTPSEWFNTAAYALPAAYTFGDAGRNSLRSARYWDWDASVFRSIPLGGSRKIQFRAEAFNLPNNVVFGTPDSNYSDGPQFGTVSSTANTSREIQLAIKYLF